MCENEQVSVARCAGAASDEVDMTCQICTCPHKFASQTDRPVILIAMTEVFSGGYADCCGGMTFRRGRSVRVDDRTVKEIG